MADTDDLTPLQHAIQRAIDAADKPRDYYDRLLQKRLGTTGKPIYDIQRGKSKSPSATLLQAIAEVMGKRSNYFMPGEVMRVEPDSPLTVRAHGDEETVEIIQLDLSLPMGPGATVDDYIEETPLRFDLDYIRAFTRTPSDRLRLARGVGDSMYPTLVSSDLVWIDSTQTLLNQQDRVWAVSINGAAAIKRLRALKAGRVMIISDNPAIGDYEVDADELLIGGRVIRFARDL